MIGDDHQPAFAGHHVHRLLDRALEAGELFVDRDAQGLEHPRRRIHAALPRAVHPGAPLPAAAALGLVDDAPELGRGGDRPLAPRLDDRSRDPARLPLLAEVSEDLFQVALRSLIDQVRSGQLGKAHAHVEGACEPEAEAALRGPELQRGNAQVEERAGDGAALLAQLRQHALEAMEVARRETHPAAEGRQAGGGAPQRLGVAVDAHQARRGSP